MVAIPRATSVAKDVIQSRSVSDGCGPICEAVEERLCATGIASRREVAIVYGHFEHPEMDDSVPHTWLFLHTPHGPGDTTLLDPTITQFEAGNEDAGVQLATVDQTFETVAVFWPHAPEREWYTPHPSAMQWASYDGTPIVSHTL